MTANANDAERVFQLKNTLYIPDLRTNLVSVGRITDKGHKVIFDKIKAEIVNGKGDVLLTAVRRDDLYYFKDLNGAECNRISETKSSTGSTKKGSLEDWHIRMGHMNLRSLREAVKSG